MLRNLLVFLALFSTNLVNAQHFLIFSDYKEKDSYRAISDQQIEYILRLYYQSIDHSNEMINGKEYFPYYYRSEIKPLLFNEMMKSGSLIMNGRKYDNLLLEYDTYLDEVIYSDKTKFYDNKSLMIVLNSEQVETFNLHFENDSLTFRHFRSGDDANFNLPEGFYEVAYDGESKYIIKHQSTVSKEKSQDAYLYSPTGYVKVGENFSRLRFKRAFVKLFGVKSGAVNKFMRSNKIHIRKEDNNKIASVLKYYDSLILSDQ